MPKILFFPFSVRLRGFRSDLERYNLKYWFDLRTFLCRKYFHMFEGHRLNYLYILLFISKREILRRKRYEMGKLYSLPKSYFQVTSHINRFGKAVLVKSKKKTQQQCLRIYKRKLFSISLLISSDGRAIGEKEEAKNILNKQKWVNVKNWKCEKGGVLRYNS